ncbi:Arc family DNA-binding protein [Tatumella punctata]|uniref:Arc family DNA-binding protein n=1 Tax=Tatumella punctata TaxID=399969 RepID=A0ABW1VMB3_9GAMM
MKDKDTTQFHLTLPADLHAKIKARAQSHGRSINMEIVRTLDDSFYKTPLSRTDQD